MRLSRILASVSAAAVLALGASACGGAANDTAATPARAATTTTAASSDATAAKVSANSASIDEIAAALSAAGVANAERWAREVEEYRPYDTSDANLTHLRDELAKYNPGDGVVDAIVATLTP